MNRSIQVEGVFGVLKEDYGFRRFLTRGKKNIETQFFLLAFALNIEKLCNRTKKGRMGLDLFTLNASWTDSLRNCITLKNEDFTDPLFVILFFASFWGFFLLFCRNVQNCIAKGWAISLILSFWLSPFFIFHNKFTQRRKLCPQIL